MPEKSAKEPNKLDPKRAAEIKELEALLDPKRTLDLQVLKTLEELPEKFCIVLVENLSNYNVINTRLAKYFVDKGMTGVYITINKNVVELTDAFKKDNIAADGIIFVDTVTRMASGREMTGDQYLYVDSPKDMLGLSVTIERAMENVTGENKFIILDSLTTMLVYNKPGAVEKFVHSLSGKIKAWNANGVFILMDTADKEIISTLAQFCDKVVTLQQI